MELDRLDRGAYGWILLGGGCTEQLATAGVRPTAISGDGGFDSKLSSIF